MADFSAVKREIEQQRIVRRLLRRSRSVGSESILDPVEQAFLDCMRAQQSDSETAVRKLRAFLTVYHQGHALTEQQRELVEIAEEALEKIENDDSKKANPAVELLNQQIEWAETELRGEAQKSFLQSIIELYSDKPWAKPAIDRVRELLKN